MKKAMMAVPLPVLHRQGRRPFVPAAVAVALVAEGVETPGVGPRGGVRAWFGRGQLGPGAGVEDARETGSRC